MPDDYNPITDAAPYPSLPGTQQFWDDTLRYLGMPAAGAPNPNESFYGDASFEDRYKTSDKSMVHAPPHGNEESTIATQDSSWQDPAPNLTDVSWEHFPIVQHPLDAHLGGALAGQGSAFEAAGKQYGVDPTLLASIATLESGHGTSRAAKVYNNPTGMMDPKNPKQFLKYDSIPDAINATAKDLSENYLQAGLSTIPQIAAKYAPPHARNDPKDTNVQWPSQVQQIYAKMGGTRTSFGPQQVGPAVAMMGGYNEPGWENFPVVQSP